MRKFWLPLLFILTACRAFAPAPAETAFPTATATIPAPTATAPATPAPPTETPTPTASPTLVLPTIEPALDLSGDQFVVRFHPDGGLFAGDQVSFEVIAPPEAGQDLENIEAWLEGGELLGIANFRGFGIQGRQQATFRWDWDTTGLQPGTYKLEFVLRDQGLGFSRSVTLLPAEQLPFPEPEAGWTVTESDCCLLYYITGTAAERDIELLAEAADLEADLAVAQLDVELPGAITIVFLPRVLGHGGFATNEIYISYLDRNYAGNNPNQVLHHELVHILDGLKGGDFRPSLFVEGLAVYLSDGHFKKEPIVPRAASLEGLDFYLPLAPLANDFYFSQHEVSYLQGAALIDYMVGEYGWEGFDAFYRQIQSMEGDSPSMAIDRALMVHFGITFSELEEGFISFLTSQPVDAGAELDVLTTVTFFDTVRRYQQALDPSAFFLTAWLLDIEDLRENGITADYVRHPSEPENIALELLLVSADAQLRNRDYEASLRSLAAVNAVIAALEGGEPAPFYADPLAVDYLGITLALLEQGYDPLYVVLNGESADVLAARGSVERIDLDMVRSSAAWEVLVASGD